MRIPNSAAALLVPFAVTVAVADPAPTPAPVRVTDPAVIAKAVRETLAEMPPEARRTGGPALRADTAEQLSRRFDDAKIPSCLHADAMKFQPPHIGPIGLGGILALPFLGVAAATGKCN